MTLSKKFAERFAEQTVDWWGSTTKAASSWSQPRSNLPSSEVCLVVGPVFAWMLLLKLFTSSHANKMYRKEINVDLLNADGFPKTNCMFNIGATSARSFPSSKAFHIYWHTKLSPWKWINTRKVDSFNENINFKIYLFA